MASSVIHSDHETFLTGWFRTALEAREEPETDGVEVDRVEPPAGEEFSVPLVIIRDDGDVDTSVVTAECSIGISVLAGTRENPQPAKVLARIVRALIATIPSGDPANPIAAVLDVRGPFLVPEAQPYAREYITVVFSVVGQPF